MSGLTAAGVYTDLHGLSGLRQAARDGSPEALRETARQFEGLFLQMMLRSMREALPGDGLFESEQTRFYQGMFDRQLGIDLAKGGGIGFAEMIYRELGDGAPRAPSSRPLTGLYAPAPPGPAEAVEKAEPVVSEAGYSESVERFVSTLWPAAQRAGTALGVDAEVLIAQSALETGWGRKVIGDGRGGSSHNLFGIKADRRWQGASVGVTSLEYEAGVAVRRQSRFRVYATPLDSFRDYVDFIRSNPRYGEVLTRAGNGKEYLQALQEAGYATDPGYANKIRTILQQRSFAAQVADLKNGSAVPLIRHNEPS